MTIELSAHELLFVALLSGLTTLCGFAAVSLVLTARHRGREGAPNLYLAALFAVLAWLASARVLGLFGLFDAVPLARGLFLPTLLLCAPLLLGFARGLAAEPARWRWIDGLHAVPALFFGTVFLLMYGDEHGAGAAMRAALGRPFGVEVSIETMLRGTYWAFFFQWTAYGAAVLSGQSQQRRALRAFFSNEQAATARRMRYVLLLVSVPWSALFVQYVVSALGYPRALEPGASILRIASLAAFAAYAVRQDWVFETARPPTLDAPSARYQRSGLGDGDLRRIAAKLDEIMARDQLYLRADLNLRDLSDATGIRENHISEALNAFVGQSFFDYVNGWRVKAAERLLRTTEQTVLDILLEVGFNARSTFNAAFRKRTGLTPTAYRRQARLESDDSAR